MAAPGEQVQALGQGCPAGSPVHLTVGGAPAATVTADGAGAFAAPVPSGDLRPGRHQVTAECGQLLTASFDVVLTSNTGTATSSTMVILFFLLVGLAVYHRRLLPRAPR